MKAAIILAGGKGTRLGDSNPPKALLELNGKTLLDCQVEWLEGKFDVIVLALGHRAQEVVDYVKKKDYKVEVSIEDAPLGSGGAVKKAFLSFCPNAEKVYVLNVDDIAQVNVADALKSSTPCIVAKPVPFSILAEGKIFAQNETVQHIGHTVLSKNEILNLPDVGSYEKWLALQKVNSFVHSGMWTPVNSLDQLHAAQQAWKK
jgi:NDP-sugar pyrophosphorylase family protein